VHRALGVAAHVGAVMPVRHGEIGAVPVAVVEGVVDGGDRTDVGALLHVRVDVDPQVRVFSIVAVAAGLHLAVDRMLDDLAGGGLVAVRLDGQRIVEGPGPVGGEVGTRVGLGADARSDRKSVV